MRKCKQVDEFRTKVLNDLKKEIDKTVCGHFHEYIYQQACYNAKIMRGLSFYRPKNIKIIIDWELDND